jgi:hypothetical protein
VHLRTFHHPQPKEQMSVMGVGFQGTGKNPFAGQLPGGPLCKPKQDLYDRVSGLRFD